MIVVVTGGSASGKSAYAEDLACYLAGEKKKYYIATMMPFGQEGKARVEKHVAERAGKGFETIERSTRFLEMVENLTTGEAVYLLEDLSNLLANMIFEEKKENPVWEIVEAIAELHAKSCDCVIVTNEIFSDGEQYGEETEVYRKLLGMCNQEMVKMADCFVEVVYSLPIYRKGEKICF